MKIIIVSQYYWPENFRVNDIAEELVKRGHRVTVITGLPDYSTNQIPKEFQNGKNRYENRNGVEIFRTPIIARHRGVFFRALNYISFYLTSSCFALLHKLDADVVVSYQTAPVLMANAAIILKHKLKIPLFFYCLDIWPDQMKVWGVRERNPLFQIMRIYSTYAYGSADVVGITTEKFKEYLTQVNGVDAERILYLPQHSEDAGEDAGFELESTKKGNGPVQLVFAGNVGNQQNVEGIIRAVSLLKIDKPYQIHVYGEGSSYAQCIRLVQELSVQDRVIFHGRVSRKELLKAYSNTDAFLLTLCSATRLGFAANTVPAKFQEYLSAGKPILSSIDGGARELIEGIKCGLTVKAEDDVGLARIIQKFVENPEHYRECGVRARNYYLEHYTRDKVMDQWVKVLSGLAGGSSMSPQRQEER